MIKHRSKTVYYLSLVGLTAGLVGCWGKDCKKSCDVAVEIPASDKSVVLLSVGGKSRVTLNSLEKDLNEIAEMDQQAKMMLQFDPEGTKERMFDEQKRMVVVQEWASQNGVRSKEEYQKKLDRIINHVQKQLDFEQFLKAHAVEVDPADVQKYYDDNKEQDYRILISPAGVKASGIEFDTKAKADEFAAQALTVSAFEKLAKDKKLSPRSLGTVNERSYVDSAVKKALAEAKHVPAVLVVKCADSKKYMVVAAMAKEVAKYQDFDKVRDAIEQMLKQKKMVEMLEVKIPAYAEQYKVVENKDYFTDLKKAREEAAKKAEETTELPTDVKKELV